MGTRRNSCGVRVSCADGLTSQPSCMCGSLKPSQTQFLSEFDRRKIILVVHMRPTDSAKANHNCFSCKPVIIQVHVYANFEDAWQMRIQVQKKIWGEQHLVTLDTYNAMERCFAERGLFRRFRRNSWFATPWLRTLSKHV